MRTRHLHLSRITCGIMVCGLLASVGLQHAQAQFSSENVSLHAWLDLDDLGGASNGNDCWGYVSGSGREYALMGVSNKMVVVEITNPASPVIVDSVSHTNTLWGDVKTYGDYAYVVNDNGGGGLDVVDLSDVDNGNVTLIQRVTSGGLSISHNVAIDEDSGFLYLCGANLNSGRLVAYDLSDPANPTLAGQVSAGEGAYVHDAEIVTYTSGPYADKQIAFCANGSTGLDIYDVTDKTNMLRLSRTTYANLSYAHQCWLSDDKQYLYLNDELDGVNETVIFDVSDLANPFVAGSYNSGLNATDHNLYVHQGFIFEAEYRAGLRVFCADDPLNPVQVGWFDSYPEDDNSGFDGAWSVYPMFPSGTVLISDIDRGLFIVDPSQALTAGSLLFDYPQGRPELINPQGGTSVRVDVSGACGATIEPGTGLLHYDAGAGFVTTPLDEISEGVYEGTFPAMDCGTEVPYYLSVQSADGHVRRDPPDAPASTYSATVGQGLIVALNDNFEVDQGWTAENLGAPSGDWQRGVPVDDPDWAYDPSTDGDDSGQCWLTQNEFGNTDIDDGAVRLTSPLLDMTAGGLGISYAYYLRLTDTDGGVDRLLVEISSTGNLGPWTVIATHDTDGGVLWRHHEISASDLQAAGVDMTTSMQVRFTANDADPQSIVEAGVDGFTLQGVDCGVPADLDGDGTVGSADLALLLAAWGPCGSCAADLNQDGVVDAIDLSALLGAWSS